MVVLIFSIIAHHNISYGLLRISVVFVGAVKTSDCIVQEIMGL